MNSITIELNDEGQPIQTYEEFVQVMAVYCVLPYKRHLWEAEQIRIHGGFKQ
jgi:hypothetical protein